MADRNRPASSSSAAGGALLAFAVMAGSVIGFIYNQPTIGFLIGGAIGVIIAIAIWLIDRRR